MPKFEVQVRQASTRYAYVEIEATDTIAARVLVDAMDESDFKWGDDVSAEPEVVKVRQIA